MKCGACRRPWQTSNCLWPAACCRLFRAYLPQILKRENPRLVLIRKHKLDRILADHFGAGDGELSRVIAGKDRQERLGLGDRGDRMRIAAFTNHAALRAGAEGAEIADRVNAVVPVLPVDFELLFFFKLESRGCDLWRKHVRSVRGFLAEEKPADKAQQGQSSQHDEVEANARRGCSTRRAQPLAAERAIHVTIRSNGTATTEPHGGSCQGSLATCQSRLQSLLDDLRVQPFAGLHDCSDQ